MLKRNESVWSTFAWQRRWEVVEGKVVDTHYAGNAMLRVELENGHQILATVSGKIRKNYIRILAGGSCYWSRDGPYDLTRGRITYR